MVTFGFSRREFVQASLAAAVAGATSATAESPTLDELGVETISDSPLGLGAPKRMDPALTKRLQDAFKKTLEDPAVVAAFEKCDQLEIYMNTADHTKFNADQYVKEEGILERRAGCKSMTAFF